MAFFFVFGVNENIIQIDNDKDIKLFCKDFIDIILKYCRSVN